MMRVGILGFGEVGQAIAKFYKKPLIKDLDRDDFVGKGKLETLHICIPFNKNFIDVVWGASQNLMDDGLMIIHSTVKLGTTKQIKKGLSRDVAVVHSPVRGIHPNICEGLRTFVKYIGADDIGDGIRVKKHYDTLGIESKIIQGSRNTEALKLWSTTQYGWNIMLEKEIYAWCEKNDVNFDVVYGDANRTYNQGFRELGHGHYNRSILKHVDGKVGGHCVTNNCKLLDAFIAETILKMDDQIDG